MAIVRLGSVASIPLKIMVPGKAGKKFYTCPVSPIVVPRSKLPGLDRIDEARKVLEVAMGTFVPDGKTATEWILEFEDGTVATIYDWKQKQTPKDHFYWSVGGHTYKALEQVKEFTGFETKQVAY